MKVERYKSYHSRNVYIFIEMYIFFVSERFKASKEESNWYYSKLNDIFKVLNNHEVYLENTKLYQYIFVHNH